MLGLWFVICGAGQTMAQQPDFSPYVSAVEECRGDIPRPLGLSSDKRLLCLDGFVTSDLDLAAAADLAKGGFAVVRSGGGDKQRAATLANLLRDRGAVVVIRDFCLQVCASFLVLASSETIVPEGALVAWGVLQRASDHKCMAFIEAEDEAGPYLTSVHCEQRLSDSRPQERLFAEFYRERIAGPAFTDPPESRFVRRALMNLYRSNGPFSPVLWTWHPRHHASTIKTKVVYQRYPQSQDEVDQIVHRLGLRWRVIYDP